MMKKLIITALAVVMMQLALVVPSVSAAPMTQMAACAAGMANFFGFQTWHACLDHNPDGTARIDSITDFSLIIFPVIDALLKVAMYVAIAYLFICIFGIITARGNQSKIVKNVDGLRDAVIGFVIALLSVGILNFVSEGLIK